MRCLYCGKQLALLRRWTGGGEFCSEAHKQSHHEEFNKLALSRLVQAQSKPDDYKRSDPESDYPAGGAASPEQVKRIAAHDPEQGWTTVQRNNQKRLPAPAAQATLPAAPKSNQAPAKANFLVDKPRLQVPQGLEPPMIAVTPVLMAPELVQPRLACKLDELQTSQPPSKAGLLELVNAPAFSKPEHRPVAAEPMFMRHSRETIRIDLALSTRSIPGFAPAELLPFEYNPTALGLGKAEPELQPAYAFEFHPILGNAATILASAAAQPPLETPAPRPEARLLNLLPLRTRPTAVRSHYQSPWSEQMPGRTFKPEFPGDIPLTLRPRVAASDPAAIDPTALDPATIDPRRVPSRPTRGTVRLNLAKPEREQRLPSNGPEPPQNVPAAGAPVALEDDIPRFLKGPERAESHGSEAEKSVWGSVQRYLKNIVGCLLFAALGGGYFGDMSASKAPDFSGGGAGMSGEADRAKPERQIFVYPASLGLRDYRVDFEAPLAGEGSVWVFRVADPRNYYGMRLEPERDGPVVQWKIQKYLEVNGEQILSGTVRLARTPQTGYCRVTLEVEGSQFRTYVQGRLVDRWTDARFSRGGFGYYGGTGEPLQIRAVRVGGLEPDAPKVDRHD